LINVETTKNKNSTLDQMRLKERIASMICLSTRAATTIPAAIAVSFTTAPSVMLNSANPSRCMTRTLTMPVASAASTPMLQAAKMAVVIVCDLYQSTFWVSA